MRLLLIRRSDRCLKIPDIIQTVKDTDDVDPVCAGFLDKIFHYVICIGTVSENVLSTEQHLQLCILEAVAELSQSLPGILLQKAQGSVESSSAPALDRVITDFVHLVDDREHLLCRHPGGDQRLMCITKDRLRYFNRFLFYFCHIFLLHFST